MAQERGYYPKAIAQGLARRHTKTIMALVPMLSNYFFMEVLAGLQDRISNSNYDLNIFNIKGFTSANELHDQIEYVMRKGQADAYILVSCHLRDEQWQTLLKKYKIPTVLVDEYHDAYDSISVDSTQGAYKATKYMLDQGHNRIGVIAASENSKPIQDRVSGYRKAMEEAGFRKNDSLIYRGDDTYRDGFSEMGGYQAMRKILDDPNGLEAVFCTSDIQALGAIKAMQDVGRTIPLVSFDDIQIAHFLGLTTMRQPMYEMGTLAIDYLLDRLEGGSQEPPKNTVFLPELIVRD
jgi:LacI family transcriptional regulator